MALILDNSHRTVSPVPPHYPPAPSASRYCLTWNTHLSKDRVILSTLHKQYQLAGKVSQERNWKVTGNKETIQLFFPINLLSR